MESLAQDDATPWLLLLGSCVLPTLVFAVVRGTRGTPRPLAALVAAWLAMWVGQFAALTLASTMVCGMLVVDWWASAPMAAIVYGMAMGIVCVWTSLLAMRLFAVGARLLAADSDARCAAACGRLWTRAALALAVVFACLFLVMPRLPMPGGQWMPLIYLALVLVPVALVSSLVALVAFMLRGPPWRA